MDNTNHFGLERITQGGMTIRFVFHLQSDAMVRIRQFVGDGERLTETNYSDFPSFHLTVEDSNGDETTIKVSMVNSISLIMARYVWNNLTKSSFNRMPYEAVLETFLEPI